MTSRAMKKTPVVAVLNMKGGVGKTTITAHVMGGVLSQSMKKGVTLVDFDPQFNLTQALVTGDVYQRLKEANTTVFSVMERPPHTSLFTVSNTPALPPKLQDVSIPLGEEGANVRLVPGDFAMVKYSLIDDASLLKPVKQRFVQFIKAAGAESDVVCLDCNPSSSFMTLCALEAATHILVPVRPDKFSLQGLDLLDQFIAKVAALPKPPKLMVVLNTAQSRYDPAVENELRGHPRFGSLTLATRLNHSKLLEASEEHTGFATDRRVPFRKHVLRNLQLLATEISQELGLTAR